MKTFKRYLIYRLEQSALRTVTLTVLSLIMTLNVISECVRYTDNEIIKFNQTGIYILAIVLGILCTVIPMLETAGFKNRRNLDTLYFFPLDRWKLALAHYISGFVQILAAYTVTFWAAFAYLAANTDYFALYHMVGYYFLSVLLGLVMYSFFIFIFGEANTVVDGVVFCSLWIAALYVVALVATTCASQIRNNNVPTAFLSDMMSWGTVYSPINNLTVIFQDLIEINRESNYNSRFAAEYREAWGMFVAWGVIGAASAFGYFVTFIRKGAQRAGEISDSVFGYRLLIPLYGYSLLFLLGSVDVLNIPIFGAMLIGYIIYRRGVKLKTSDFVFTACGIIALICGMMIN